MNPKLTLMLVAAMFLLSPVAAWLYRGGYFGGQDEITGGKNNGELVYPVRSLDNILLESLDGGVVTQRNFLGLWTLLGIAGRSCVQDCMKNIYKMRQVRLALGKDAHRVQRVVLAENFAGLGKIMNDNPGTRFYRLIEASQDMLLKFPGYTHGDISPVSGRVYIVDPLGNLMMRYPEKVNPSLVLEDLRQLLKATWIRPITAVAAAGMTAGKVSDEE